MGWKELFYTSVTGKSTVPHRASVSMHVKGEAAAAQICSKDNVMCSADEIELLYLKSRSRFRLYKALNRACLIGCLAFFLFPYK